MTEIPKRSTTWSKPELGPERNRQLWYLYTGMCKILVNLHANDIFPPHSFGMVKSYTMPCTVESASLESQLGNKFVAGGEDMWIRLFDFHTGEEIACNKGHHGPVHCVRFSPGGESYASGSEDGTIRIWQTGPAGHDENDTISANGSTGKLKVPADEIALKIEGFHIAKDGLTQEKIDGADA